MALEPRIKASVFAAGGLRFNTPAESRVMMLLVQGMAPAEVAETLGISLPTARTHLARLLDKTGTNRQADLVRLAMSALAPTAAGG